MQPPPSPPRSIVSLIAPPERKSLLELARRALELGVRTGESLADFPQEENLAHPAGAFVTLRLRGRLRGCIGQLPAEEPLALVVAHCAKAAAFDDPRFEPVRAEELPEIEIELSILSPLQDILPEMIEAGKHGLSVSRGWQRGLLLPQVAAQFNWNAEKFLEETCVKAGLERDAWKDSSTRIQFFTAEVFREADFRAGGSGQPDFCR
jgi:AmmeMemoRadiSam system protein A